MKIRKDLNIIFNSLNIKVKNDNDDLFKYPNYDSIKHLELIMTIEEKFKIKFSINENFNINTVSLLEEVIKKKFN